MKKQFLLPVFAVLLAVSGAYASSRFTIGYYTNSDTSCSTPLLIPQCTPGTQEECVGAGGQFRYKLDVTDTEEECKLLFYNP